MNKEKEKEIIALANEYYFYFRYKGNIALGILYFLRQIEMGTTVLVGVENDGKKLVKDLLNAEMLDEFLSLNRDYVSQ